MNGMVRSFRRLEQRQGGRITSVETLVAERAI
jgi:hypothetical protein